jgi:hypothetical protein
MHIDKQRRSQTALTRLWALVMFTCTRFDSFKHVFLLKSYVSLFGEVLQSSMLDDTLAVKVAKKINVLGFLICYKSVKVNLRKFTMHFTGKRLSVADDYKGPRPAFKFPSRLTMTFFGKNLGSATFNRC